MKTWGEFAVILYGVIVFLFGCVSPRVTSNRPLSENDVFKSSDYGQPLFLTPYLKAGNIEKARTLSQVGDLPDAPKVKSFSGFFTVNKKYSSNIFFWFFPAMNEDKDAPVILWLQGGPGSSGLFGLFIEHGPYFIHSNMTADIREYHWAKTFHVIYVDNPVGAGFSFTNDIKGYVTNEQQMANNMYQFLQQFFTLFYEYRNNEFYITGESYAGKYVPALAYKIHKEGASSKINFKGMAIGNGLCDPETMLDYSDYLYQLGLIDRKQASFMRNASDSIVQLIRKKEYYEALIEVDKLILDFNVLNYTSYFKHHTDYDFFFNFLLTQEPDDFKYFREYIRSPEVRKAIHVGFLTFQNGELAQTRLLTDIMKSVKSKVAVIMDNYRVLFYNGQLDLVIPYPATINFLHSVKWKYAGEYADADRQIWKLEGSDKVAGYVHNVNDFFEILVRDAGHILPYDQPKVALDLITRFIKRQPYA